MGKQYLYERKNTNGINTIKLKRYLKMQFGIFHFFVVLLICYTITLQKLILYCISKSNKKP